MRVVDSEDAPIESCALTVAFATCRPDRVEARKYGPYERTTDERGELDLATLLDELAQRLEREEHMALIALGAREELTPPVLERSALGATRELAAVVVRKTGRVQSQPARFHVDPYMSPHLTLRLPDTSPIGAPCVLECNVL